MIDRYSRKVMTDIWSDQKKYQIWYEIERYACEAQADLGVIPKEIINTLDQNKHIIFDAKRINEIEKETKHDVIAFLTFLSEIIGDHARFIHQGMTSSDILDTCFSIQLFRSSELLIEDLKTLLKKIKNLAFKHKFTKCIGRSHGIHAEPTTFGLKMAQAYTEMNRNLTRLKTASEEIRVGAISGAVGNYSSIDPKVEEYVCKKLGLKVEEISTQIIPRDRHAAFFSTLSVIASSIERLAVEIRHLQRTEIMEVSEFFSKGQKGSSAMPHKKNPIHSENLTGLSRLIRMSVIPSLENIALWHERDISHSSVERVIGPDTTVILDFALTRLSLLMENLIVYPENMEKNLYKLNGVIFSQNVLLKLTQKGMSREESYKIVQKNALKAIDDDVSFKDLLLNDKETMYVISPKELDQIFDISRYFKHVDTIYKRIFS